MMSVGDPSAELGNAGLPSRSITPLLLVLSVLWPSLIGAAEPPETSSCPPAPGLIAAKADCARGELEADACAWIPIIERHFSDGPEVAAVELSATFGLSADSALSLAESLYSFTVFFIEPDCSAEGLVALVTTLLESAINKKVFDSPDVLLLSAHLFASEAKDFTRLAGAFSSPGAFAKSSRASRGFLELVRATGSLKMFRRVQPPTPEADAGEAMRLEEHLPTDLERVDRILDDMDSSPLTKIREELDALAADVEPDLEGRVLARAGLGFYLSNTLEDALIYLMRAESTLSKGSGATPDRELLQLTRGHLASLLKTLQRGRDADLMQERLQSSKPSDFIHIFTPIDGAIHGDFTSYMEMLPSLDWGSEEAFRAYQAMEIMMPEGQLDSPSPTMSLHIMPDLFTSFFEGGTSRMNEKIEGLANSNPSVLLPLLPAISGLFSVFNEDLEGAHIGFDQAVHIMERSLEGQRVDAVTRGVVDWIGYAVFPLAAHSALLAEDSDSALAYVERGRALATRKRLGASHLVSSSASPLEASLEARIVTLERDAVESTRSRETERLYAEFEAARFKRQAVAAPPEQPPDGTSTSSSIRDLQAGLSPNETALVFFISEGHLWTWHLGAEETHFERSEWNPQRARALNCEIATLRWQGTLRERGAERLQVCREEASQIDLDGQQPGGFLEHLLPSSLSAGGTLFIVPHGPLHRVPWAAVRGASGRPLADDFAVTVLPSLDSLTLLRAKSSSIEPGAKSTTDLAEMIPEEPADRALVLGDPTTHLPSLEAARREARDVADLLGVEALIGEEATEASFWEKAPEAPILHIAAHGVYEAEHPLFSRLQLAEGREHDGFLHVHEIWDRLDLRRNRLVVLSACDTAAGEPTRGDDIIGLTQAFLVAGAPSVISTLWPVDDPASATLMTSFYRHFRGGATTGQSLRRAQGEMMRSKEHSAPYFWAGFTLVGDPDTRWPTEPEEGR